MRHLVAGLIFPQAEGTGRLGLCKLPALLHDREIDRLTMNTRIASRLNSLTVDVVDGVCFLFFKKG